MSNPASSPTDVRAVGHGGPLADLVQEISPRNLAAAALAALVVALSAVVSAIGVAALVFTGPLQPFLVSGIGVALFGTTAMLAILALTSSYPGSICLPQVVPAVILSLLATALFTELTETMPAEEALPLVLFAIALVTVITGAVFLLLGALRLGGLIRFIPYPMVGGVLAGLGWLLVQGGVTVLTDKPLALETLAVLLSGDNPVRIASGFLIGIVLLAVTARISHFTVIPLLLVLSVVGFYVVVLISGQGVAAVQADGWLLGPFPEGRIWAPIAMDTLARFEFSLLLSQAPVIGTVVLACSISILLHASGLELGVRRDVDLNHELWGCGLANLGGAIGGGLPGYHSLGDSLLAHAMGAPFRLTGLTAAGVIGLGLIAGFDLLALFPRPVLAGLLIFLGLSLLSTWVVQGYRRLPTGDWLVVMLILAVSGWFGFLEGVGVGIVAGIILFTINYSRVDVAKHELSGAEFWSNVDRPMHERRILERQGRSIYVVTLNGFVFFGTANKVQEKVRARIDNADEPPVSHVVLDFERVTGLDSSSLITFRKLDQLAEANDFLLVLTGLSETAREMLAASELDVDADPRIRIEADLDHGLELCEEQLLADTQRLSTGDLSMVLPGILMDGRLLEYAELCTFEEGDRLIRQGTPADDMYVILSGRVSVRLEGARATDHRLHTYSSGTLVGEMALYKGGSRSASVVAETPTRALRISRDAITRMTRDDPRTAADLHRAIATVLAERVARSNVLLQQLS